MSDKTRVSVVIPSFNRAASLPRALDSVLAQTRPADEIIVVDDGSSDGSAELLATRYAGITCLRQPNQGVSAARNLGIQHASGDWIAFLDSDDTWLPDKLQAQLDMLEQSANCPLCHTEEIWIRNGTRVNAMKKHAKRGGWIYPHCLPLCVISPSSALIRRNILLDAGGFDTRLPACEDYDLWLRLCSRYPVAYVDQPKITKYGGHADQLSRAHWGMDRFRIQALQRALREYPLSDADRDATRAMLLKKTRILIQGALKRGNQTRAVAYQRIHTEWAGGDAP